MTIRNELHKAIKIVLDVIDLSGSLIDYIELDDTDISWDMFESAIETLQSVINEE